MQAILQQILDVKRREIERLYEQAEKNNAGLSIPEHSQNNGEGENAFTQRLASPGFHLISEFKRCSPSRRETVSELSLSKQVTTYLECGASAVSVLTETTAFHGSLQDGLEAMALCHLQQTPVLRKDFILDEIQLHETAALGFDAVLLISGILGASLEKLYHTAIAFGLDVLVEVHTADEYQQAHAMGAKCIGINNRDLTTFIVDPNHAMNIYQSTLTETQRTDGTIHIAESGVSTTSQAKAYQEIGFNGLLIGNGLMQADNPGAVLEQLKGQCHDSAA